jgi:eukaryotic-like serine/threonine-protein kinase
MVDPATRVSFAANEPVSHEGETLIAPIGTSPLSTASSIPSAVSGPLLADRYEILGLIGVGGMGSVYRARDHELEELVALKVLRKDLVSTPGILDRFRREVKLARRVTHRNVARVFDIGEHHGDRFLTMELVDGESLGALVAREGALPLARVVELCSGICAGLTSAHAAGVVHRDLKPDNVLIASDGRVVLTDFGIARAFTDLGAGSTMGMLVGTPAYMAPEQVEGHQDIDARADIYAFGVVLYELLTGRRAWPGESPLAVAAARLMADPPDPRRVSPTISDAVSGLVLKCMARRRDDRFASVEAIVAALSTITWSALPAVQASTERDAATAITGVQAASRPEKTVAVLPFRNAGSPDDDYLAAELTDDLIDSLSMTRGLKVRSRGAVLGYAGGSQDPREIGRDLGVQVVVEGSVRRARGSVRISARLISVADGFQLWAKRFDRPEQDVLSINDEAAHAIADALTLDREAPAREAPSSPEAVDLYLRARHEYRKFWQQDQERALALYAQAEALAPRDPMILSGKALALSRQSFFTGRGVAEARASAEQAVAAAPNLAEARLALGSVLLQQGEWVPAVRELRQALNRGPGLAETHAAVGRVLMEVGDIDEAVRRLEAAIGLDPRAPLATEALVRCHALRGETAVVDELLATIVGSKEDSAFWTTRARMLIWRRDQAGAAALLEELMAFDPELLVAKLMLSIVAHRRLPNEMRDQQLIAVESVGGRRRRTFFMQMEAETNAYIGQLEAAFVSVKRCVDGGLIDLGWIDHCPLLDEIRPDPRFPAVRAVVKQRADEILHAYRTG